MKILHTVQNYYPFSGGSEEVVRQLSEHLVRRGHEVTVATSSLNVKRDYNTYNGVKIKSFAVQGNIVHGIQGPDAERYVEYVVNSEFDIVMAYAAQIWSTDLLLPVLPQISAGKVIVPCGYSGLRMPEFADYFAAMPNYLRNFDRAVYMSPNYQDKRFSDQHGLTNGIIIYNGAADEEFETPSLGFRKKFGIRTKYLLVNIANFYAAKGHDHVIHAFQQLARNDTTLVLIGNPVPGIPTRKQKPYQDARKAALLNRRIHILQYLPREWVVSALKEADLFVFGSEIECSPLVIIEAMAAGTPFVSTNCGDVMDREQYGRVFEHPSQLVYGIEFFLHYHEYRKRIGQKAKEAWRAQYTWERITDQYEKMYQEIIGEGREI